MGGGGAGIGGGFCNGIIVGSGGLSGQQKAAAAWQGRILALWGGCFYCGERSQETSVSHVTCSMYFATQARNCAYSMH